MMTPNPLPGFGPIDLASVNAAKAAYIQEQIKTEQARQQMLQAQQQNAANRDQREEAAHTQRMTADAERLRLESEARTQRMAADAERLRLESEYRDKQFQFQQARAASQDQSNLVRQLSDLMKTYGQLWFWEEQVLTNRADIAEKHRENWERLRLQKLNDAVLQELAMQRAIDSERHNRQMEWQDLQSRIERARETSRNNHANEYREWCYRNASLYEAHRHNLRMEHLEVGRLMENARWNDVRTHVEIERLQEAQRTNQSRERNDAFRAAIQAQHYMNQERIQQQNTRRSGGRGCLKGLAVLFTIVAGFVGFLVFLFINAGGATPEANNFDTGCFITVGIVLLIGLTVMIFKIVAWSKRRKQDKAYQKWMKSLAQPSQQISLPPQLPQHLSRQGQPVPPWVWNQQGPGQPMPPFPNP